MNLEADNVEAGARENFDHPAWTNVRELEIVGLNQDQRLFDLRVLWKLDRLIENAALAIGKFRPKFEVALDRFCIQRRNYRRFEVSDLPESSVM